MPRLRHSGSLSRRALAAGWRVAFDALLLVLAGVSLLRHPQRGRPQAIPHKVAAPAPAPRWAFTRPLVTAVAAALLGVAVLTIPHRWHSSAAASVEVSSPQALRNVDVRGASAGMASAELSARSFSIERPEAASTLRRQSIEVTVPVAEPAACLKLARALGGGCDAPAQRAIASEDFAVDGDALLGLRMAAAARPGVT